MGSWESARRVTVAERGRGRPGRARRSSGRARSTSSVRSRPAAWSASTRRRRNPAAGSACHRASTHAPLRRSKDSARRRSTNVGQRPPSIRPGRSAGSASSMTSSSPVGHLWPAPTTTERTHGREPDQPRPPCDAPADGRPRTTEGDRAPVLDVRTDADGWVDRLGPEGAAFALGDPFRSNDMDGPQLPDRAPVRFAAASPDPHYRVPLPVAPYGYTTYRGS